MEKLIILLCFYNIIENNEIKNQLERYIIFIDLRHQSYKEVSYSELDL